jgi:non-specific serine/threonine protein kinase
MDPANTATTIVSDTRLVVGTLAYMAPEQLLGGEVDARTDVHAAGFVLYEMAAGRRPFADVERSQLIGALLSRAPTPLSQVTPTLSAELQRVIGKCLEHDPANRYRSGTELAIDLRRLQGAEVAGGWSDQPVRRTEAARVESLAVLPLENLSGDPQQEFFADGITESLITDLGRLTGLKRVIARGSVMRYKGTKASPAEIAHELNVDALITGAILRSPDRVRVTAQ